MPVIRTIFYIDDDLDLFDNMSTRKDIIERCYEDTTTLSMKEWLIQHNERRGADINDKDGVKTGARWEEEDEFLVYEHEINIRNNKTGE
jgi:hypothetical protein